MKKSKILLLSLLLVTTLSSCSYFFQTSGGQSSNNNPSEVLNNDVPKEVVNITSTTPTGAHSNLVEMIEDVRPSVVDINSYSVSFSASGSGVIVGSSEDSYYIITNHHVIDDATNFEVVVYTSEDVSKTYDAYLIGTSKENDIAALKITTEDELKCVSFIEDSSKVKVGTEVVAIGNPLGILGGTVTHGIVSAVQREVYLQELGYMELIQTDAAINSGNSGGALFNNEGLLVGIVNSGYTGAQGLNFAIPANIARECFTSIINTYKNNGNNYGYYEGESNIGMSIGVATVYVSNSSNSQIDVVFVESVEYGSDAQKSGVVDYSSYMSGNSSYFYAIEKINGEVITDLEEAIKDLENTRAGDTVTLTCKKIEVYRQFLGAQYYLIGDSFTVTISASQYIYTMPY